MGYFTNFICMCGLELEGNSISRLLEHSQRRHSFFKTDDIISYFSCIFEVYRHPDKCCTAFSRKRVYHGAHLQRRSGATYTCFSPCRMRFLGCCGAPHLSALHLHSPRYCITTNLRPTRSLKGCGGRVVGVSRSAAGPSSPYIPTIDRSTGFHTRRNAYS
jgi:hypothetical protein